MRSFGRLWRPQDDETGTRCAEPYSEFQDKRIALDVAGPPPYNPLRFGDQRPVFRTVSSVVDGVTVLSSLWVDRSPSKRCDWIDQLRGWAVIVMIEVHVVNAWLYKGWVPGWLSFVNGLVAPSFILCAGYSLVLSTFKSDGTLRRFWPETARRLGFVLLCAYILHAPGVNLASWTVLSTPQKLHEGFKIDVLQCIVFSLLILQLLARLVRRPAAFAFAALACAVGVAWASPHLWRRGVADGLWLPIRGLVNGNADRGVQALFPLFPWLAFAAFGSVLGVLYRYWRVVPMRDGRAQWSEGRWLVLLTVQGLALAIWGSMMSRGWLAGAEWALGDLGRLHNTTLPSVAQRAGIVCLAGALMGALEVFRPRLPGPNPVAAASRESLLVYMFHLILVFGVLLSEQVSSATGLVRHSLGWAGSILMTALVMGMSLGVALVWQRVRPQPTAMRAWQRRGLAILGVWFVVGGWWSFQHFIRSPELAEEPYPFLNAARVHKGLAPTPDGLCRNPTEYFRETARRRIPLSDDAREKIREQIQARTEAGAR